MNTIISPRQSGKNTLLKADAELGDLTQKALTLAGEALKTGCDRTHETLVDVALTLDAAKARLALDGLDYLDAAQAFVVAGRKTIDVLGTGLGIVRLREAVQS